MKTHYQTLGIPNCSDMLTIKKAYKSLALLHHPDRGGNTERMQEINVAYEYLIKNKKMYDLTIRPSKPVFVRTGFTIIINGYDWFNSTSTVVF